MENTFDINTFDKDRLSSPATYNQCRGLAIKFSKTGDKVDWRKQKQILGCLYGLAKEQRFNFKHANDLFSKSKLPKVYFDKIAMYLENNS